MTRINPIDPIYRDKKRDKPNDSAYLAWLRKQPSAFSGRTPCEACHYRTSINSGIGIKPLYSAVPLTSDEHQDQHRIGTYKFAARDWWEAQVKKYQIAYEMTGGTIPGKYRADLRAWNQR